MDQDQRFALLVRAAGVSVSLIDSKTRVSASGNDFCALGSGSADRFVCL